MIKLTLLPFAIQLHTVGTLPRALFTINYLVISLVSTIITYFSIYSMRAKLTFMPFVIQHHTVGMLLRAHVFSYSG